MDIAAVVKADSGLEKWEVPKDPLQLEALLKTMVPPEYARRAAAKQFIDGKIAEIGEENGAQRNPEKAAWLFWKAQLELDERGTAFDHEFVADFWAWLQGKGEHSDHEKTKWGRQPAHGDDVKAYLGSFVDRKYAFARKLTDLYAFGPKNLVEYYLYFKYIVRGDWDRNDAGFGFLEEFEFFTRMDTPNTIVGASGMILDREDPERIQMLEDVLHATPGYLHPGDSRKDDDENWSTLEVVGKPFDNFHSKYNKHTESEFEFLFREFGEQEASLTELYAKEKARKEEARKIKKTRKEKREKELKAFNDLQREIAAARATRLSPYERSELRQKTADYRSLASSLGVDSYLPPPPEGQPFAAAAARVQSEIDDLRGLSMSELESSKRKGKEPVEDDSGSLDLNDFHSVTPEVELREQLEILSDPTIAFFERADKAKIVDFREGDFEDYVASISATVDAVKALSNTASAKYDTLSHLDRAFFIPMLTKLDAELERLKAKQEAGKKGPSFKPAPADTSERIRIVGKAREEVNEVHLRTEELRKTYDRQAKAEQDMSWLKKAKRTMASIPSSWASFQSSKDDKKKSKE